MKPARLRRMEIEWDSKGLLPNPEDTTIGSEERIRNKDLAWRISTQASKLQLVGAFFFYQLKKVDMIMARPPASRVLLYLSREPEPGVRVTKGTLLVAIAADPMKLLELSNDAAEMGEFALSCWERSFTILSAETDFPVLDIRPLMDAFRQQGYTQDNTLPLQPIGGSRAKARLHGKVSCARTLVWLEVRDGNRILFERLIWDAPQQIFNLAYMKREIEVDQHKLIVRAGPLNLAPEVSLPLDSLPRDFLKTLK
jgi:hypothetical protein